MVMAIDKGHFSRVPFFSLYPQDDYRNNSSSDSSSSGSSSGNSNQQVAAEIIFRFVNR